MEIIYNKAKIHYRVEGKLKHNTLVLLHGFMESLDIWDIFSAELSIDFKVISIDLPGHGESECLSDVHSMELMADAVKAVLDKENIEECVMVGHSMGGYVTLAFADKYPAYLKGLGLFHSSSFADTPQGRINRERAITAIENNHSEFISNFIPDLFAPEKREKLETEIKALIVKANKMSKQAIIAAQKGMLAREDRRVVLEKAKYPVLFIAGKQDTRVTFDIALQQLTLPKDTVALLLHDIAHMGYLEAEEKTLFSIKCFTEGAF
jgi:pimeloyl-ACP methyl ester carboxylesterase